MLLTEIAKTFDERKLPYAVAGGYAVALNGAVRGTVDVDLVIRLKKADFVAAEAALRTLGLRPKLPVTAAEVFDFRDEYRKNKNMIAWSFVNPANAVDVVDIVLTHDLSRLRTKTVVVQGQPVRVLAKEELIEMKRRSGRPQDLEDIRALKAIK